MRVHSVLLLRECVIVAPLSPAMVTPPQSVLADHKPQFPHVRGGGGGPEQGMESSFDLDTRESSIIVR
jgi:hypothetical protein